MADKEFETVKKQIVEESTKFYDAYLSVFTGNACVIYGNNNVIYGNACTVAGSHNIVYGNACIVTGDRNLVSGTNCIVTGNDNLLINKRVIDNGKRNVKKPEPSFIITTGPNPVIKVYREKSVEKTEKGVSVSISEIKKTNYEGAVNISGNFSV